MGHNAMLVPFETWSAVIAHVRSGKPIWYQAPLDARPVSILATVRGENPRKVRVSGSRDYDTFFADSGHLDRFRQRGSES